MSSAITLFVVEGESRDYRFISSMTDRFFRGKLTAKIICLPAAQNLYMLYQKMKEDDFETDIVEVLREQSKMAREALEGISRQDIDQVYMFFDYDSHQNNVQKQEANIGKDVVEHMLSVYNDETENGKLYISYPMVEALYDYRDMQCQAFYRCFVPLIEGEEYKRHSGDGNPNANFHSEISAWESILSVYGLRVQCLFEDENVDAENYSSNVTPMTVFNKQQEAMQKYEGIFVLSALPEFLFDYFKNSFKKHFWKNKRFSFEHCQKEENSQVL